MAIEFYDDGDTEDDEDESTTAICLVCFELVMLIGSYYFIFSSHHVS